MITRCLLAGVVLAAGPPNPRPITLADSVVAIYAQNWGRPSGGGPKLILAAWGDGYVVWSQDRLQGGEPYLAGQVSPARVSAVLERVEREGAFGDPRLAQPCFGPDSSFTTILFRKAARQVKMDSKIIAEGIEREGERQACVDLGIHYGQGYLLGRPGELVLQPVEVPVTASQESV